MTINAKIGFRMSVPITFPEGVHPGAGGSGNQLAIAKDGLERPVLRGTAIAGVIRSAVHASGQAAAANVWFGEEVREDAASNPSRIVVEDCLLDMGAALIADTTHNGVNRHTHAVYDRALFSVSRLPPGTRATLHLTLVAPKDEDADAEACLRTIGELFQGGLVFGGAAARGMGRAEVANDITCKRYELSGLEGKASWLDDQYARRKGASIPGMNPMKVTHELAEEALKVTVTFKLVRGQDMLVAEGADMSPIQRVHADGKTRWVIPGSSLRGVFRSWMTRLAAREGKQVADSAKDFQEQGAMKFDTLGWGGKDGEARQCVKDDPRALKCPILQLFGSLYAKGRLHIADAYSAMPAEDHRHTQKRMHVAVDRFSGGANEGALFDNYVLVDHKLEFPCSITIASPSNDEVRWLAQTLRALDLGLVRLGSSKASGRLTFDKPLSASGAQQKLFNKLMMEG